MTVPSTRESMSLLILNRDLFYYALLVLACVRAPAISQPPSGCVTVSSPSGTVLEVDYTIAETAFIYQFELHADIVGEGPFAASHHDRRDE